MVGNGDEADDPIEPVVVHVPVVHRRSSPARGLTIGVGADGREAVAIG
jgi:hypothetical protein